MHGYNSLVLHHSIHPRILPLSYLGIHPHKGKAAFTRFTLGDHFG